MTLLLNQAVAYVNFGRWVAECPTGCGSACALEDNQPFVHCQECTNFCPVLWPDNAQEIWDELVKRPLPRTRNWFPLNHELAIRSGSPHGQTANELRVETLEHTAEEISPFWSETFDNGGEPKQRDCPECVANVPHAKHWAIVEEQDRGL